jgi:AraC-like DNA-binding protein
MKRSTQANRIARAFGVESIASISGFTPRGLTMTAAAISAPGHTSGHGTCSFADDAFLILLGTEKAQDIAVRARDRQIAPVHLGENQGLVIDLATVSDIHWRGPLDVLVAYLPRHAVFEGHSAALADTAIRSGVMPQCRFLVSIDTCLRHALACPRFPYANALGRQMLLALAACIASKEHLRVDRSFVREVSLSIDQRALATSYVSTHPDLDISASDLADACGIPFATFVRAFRHSVGTTPHDWLMARRLERAKHMMAETELRLSDIAATVGFCDQSHFNRVFTRHTGYTPGEWRKLFAAVVEVQD